MSIVDTILSTLDINTDTTIGVDYERAALVHDFVRTQYTAIGTGQSHAQSLYIAIPDEAVMLCNLGLARNASFAPAKTPRVHPVESEICINRS